jgi:hypothetical protein
MQAAFRWLAKQGMRAGYAGWRTAHLVGGNRHLTNLHGVRCARSGPNRGLRHQPERDRGCKSGLKCDCKSFKLEPEATQTPEIKRFGIRNDEQQKEKHVANQFFSSL